MEADRTTLQTLFRLNNIPTVLLRDLLKICFIGIFYGRNIALRLTCYEVIYLTENYCTVQSLNFGARVPALEYHLNEQN